MNQIEVMSDVYSSARLVLIAAYGNSMDFAIHGISCPRRVVQYHEDISSLRVTNIIREPEDDPLRSVAYPRMDLPRSRACKKGGFSLRMYEHILSVDNRLATRTYIIARLMPMSSLHMNFLWRKTAHVLRRLHVISGTILPEAFHTNWTCTMPSLESRNYYMRGVVCSSTGCLE